MVGKTIVWTSIIGKSDKNAIQFKMHNFVFNNKMSTKTKYYEPEMMIQMLKGKDCVITMAPFCTINVV